MAQAESITTAILELMSRVGPPKSTSPMRAAHTELVAALAGNPPQSITALVESDELEGRADHVKYLFAAIQVYLTAIIADTAQNIPGGCHLDGRYLDNLFADVASDALSVIRN